MNAEKKETVQTLHERGLTLLSLECVNDVVFDPKAADPRRHTAFRRSLGIDVVYTVVGHSDWETNGTSSRVLMSPREQYDDITEEVGLIGLDGIKILASQDTDSDKSEIVIDFSQVKEITSANTIIDRFRASRAKFEERQAAKKEPQLVKTSDAFVA